MENTNKNNNKLHRTIDFNGCHYYFIQRLEQNICIYHSEVATIATVKVEPENDPAHRYYVLGLTSIDNYYESGWESDDTKYELSASVKNKTGYAQPIEFSDY